MNQTKLIFKPHFVQNGKGPHIDNFVFASDRFGDVFKTDIQFTREGIEITDAAGVKFFGINLRWNVEGYGFLFIGADNAGDYYSFEESKTKYFNLNYELANSRVRRNENRFSKFSHEGFIPSREVDSLHTLSFEYLENAKKHLSADEELCAQKAQISLKHALWVSDILELEKSQFDVAKIGYRKDFFFGCDTRGYFQMDEKIFFERFTELFNYATITHYLKGDLVDFEPEEGNKKYKERDKLLDKLLDKGITIEGRPLFWVHKWVTPDWLKKKSYKDLLRYVEDHVHEVVSHYGDKIKVWEVVNEMHDWANEMQLDHDQTIELTKIAFDTARKTNPDAQLLLNNCCPFGDYVQKGKWHDIEARYPQRTPHQFTKQLIEAGVDFDVIGIQVYFTHRSASDQILQIERYKEFGKKAHLAEVGAPSVGIKQEFNEDESGSYSQHPYEWHRHWDEELQADWLEYTFTYAYGQEFIEASNWYDFVDPYAFLKHGGIIRSPKGEKKAAVDRLLKLQQKFKYLK
ncbi:MAG: endo-1,4-beta-xylanase [Melioribacteraceae bacterium]|nr:endo-1,4-beta-xylanase [Melioribacteraceae bacterium]MCF8412352.1 endo-1,4-beta-xylanase [Melioribacteraceae bacterium]